MRVALISGSRSDRNALVMVEKALKVAGHDAKLAHCIELGLPPSEAFDFMAEAVPLVTKAETPDIVIIHGDRHEMLAVAAKVNILGFPIAHIGGGDITEGSQDDCFRHAITKLSHLHFASNQDSADRIVQMGEEPGRVHVTGCPGIDMVMATPVLEREETFAAVGLARPVRSLVVLFHPDTLGGTTSDHLEALSVALSRRAEALVLLGPNADAGGDLIRREWQRLAQNRPDTVYHDNVEPQVFYSLLRWCDVLVGNSSAGFYEAPCFDRSVVNIGDRQDGRVAVHVNNYRAFPTTQDIQRAIDMALAPRDGHKRANPYGDGHAADRIAKVIGGIKDPRALLRKKFHNAFSTLLGQYARERAE